MRLGGAERWKAEPRADGSIDGSWWICESALPSKCKAFTFGLGYDWSFDEALSRRCEVRSFDPSMSTPAHTHQPGNIAFFPVGLGARDEIISEPTDPSVSWRLDKATPQVWTMRTLRTLQQDHGAVHVVKMDVEGFEWDALLQALQDGALASVRQVLVEVHVHDVARAVHLLGALRNSSFRVFRSVPNTRTKRKIVLPSGRRIPDCYELSLVRVSPVPYRIFQTDGPARIPPPRWQDANPGLAYTFFDDARGRHYLMQSWCRRYALAFDALNIGALRGDFLRLCYLADRGGFYADVDVCPGRVGLRAVLRSTWADAFAMEQKSFLGRSIVWNAFFGVVPRHPLMLRFAREALKKIESREGMHGGPEALLEIAGPRLLAPLLTSKNVALLENRGVKNGQLLTSPPHMDPKNVHSLYNQTAWMPGYGSLATECPADWSRRAKQLQLLDPDYWMNRARSQQMFAH